MTGKAAVFIDRDGTINRDVPYCSRPDQFELLPTVGEAIKLLNEHGYIVVIITNQSGIARGYFSEHNLKDIHLRMRELLSEYHGHVDGIYYCPHHPDDRCKCRKPEPAMILQASLKMNINIKESFMVGDSEKDIETGINAGCKATVKVGQDEAGTKADFVSNNLLDAVNWILSR
jgi:D,D-heptose 1,7-bisphosphate phosphatase